MPSFAEHIFQAATAKQSIIQKTGRQSTRGWVQNVTVNVGNSFDGLLLDLVICHGWNPEHHLLLRTDEATQSYSMSNRRNWTTEEPNQEGEFCIPEPSRSFGQRSGGEEGKGRRYARECPAMGMFIQGEETKANAAGGFLYIKARVHLAVCSWCWVAG